MRRAAVALVALTVAGCGSGGGGPAPQGNPDARRGPAAVDAYASVEFLRALLIASSDEYAAGGSAADARGQLQRARASYDVLAPRVRAADPVVDREVTARFDVIQHDMRQGIGSAAYRGLAGPLFDQLMDGVVQALVPPAARSDRGVQAEALRRVTTRLAATYDASANGSDPDTARLAFEESWGLWRRAQVLAGLIKGNLGAEQDTVMNTVNDLRTIGFPNGPTAVDVPPAQKVDAAAARIVNALLKRFGLAS